LLDYLGNVLGEDGSGQGVVVGRGCGRKVGLVGGSTKGNHLILIVLEQDSNAHIALLFDGVLNEVLTIVFISDGTGDFNSFVGLDVDLEDVTA